LYVKNQDDNGKSGTGTIDLTGTLDTNNLEKDTSNNKTFINENQSKKDKINSLRKKLALK
jgi:hypothetical protein